MQYKVPVYTLLIVESKQILDKMYKVDNSKEEGLLINECQILEF